MGGNKMNYQQTSLWKNSIDNEERVSQDNTKDEQ